MERVVIESTPSVRKVIVVVSEAVWLEQNQTHEAPANITL
jgi:hypothetical protein